MNRLCLSGAPYCSGLNPCETCHIQVMTRVLPKAMIAGGFNQNPVQAKAFFDAYVQGWKDLQSSLPAEAQRPLFQSPAPAAPSPPTSTVAPAVPEQPQELRASPPQPASPPPVEKSSTEPLPLPPVVVEPDEAVSPLVIPPPIVEGLTETEESVPDAPISESVPKKHRRRGLPRSLRRAKKVAGQNDTKKED